MSNFWYLVYDISWYKKVLINSEIEITWVEDVYIVK